MHVPTCTTANSLTTTRTCTTAHSLTRLYYVYCTWGLFVLVGSLLARCRTHVLGNAIDPSRYDGPLFVEANADRTACVHITNGPLQRQENIKCTRTAFCIFSIIASLACDYMTLVKLKMNATLIAYSKGSVRTSPAYC